MDGTQYQALAAELATDPAKLGYAAMTDAQAAAALAAQNQAVTVDVPAQAVMDALMLSGSWVAVQQLAQKGALSGQSPPTTADEAFAAAVSLYGLCTTGQNVEMSTPAVAAAVGTQLAALVATGTIAGQDQTDVLALAQSETSRAAAIGCVELMSDDAASVAFHVHKARAGTY